MQTGESACSASRCSSDARACFCTASSEVTAGSTLKLIGVRIRVATDRPAIDSGLKCCSFSHCLTAPSNPRRGSDRRVEVDLLHDRLAVTPHQILHLHVRRNARAESLYRIARRDPFRLRLRTGTVPLIGDRQTHRITVDRHQTGDQLHVGGCRDRPALHQRRCEAPAFDLTFDRPAQALGQPFVETGGMHAPVGRDVHLDLGAESGDARVFRHRRHGEDCGQQPPHDDALPRHARRLLIERTVNLAADD